MVRRFAFGLAQAYAQSSRFVHAHSMDQSTILRLCEDGARASRDAEDGNLPFGYRLALWRGLDEVFPDESKYAQLCAYSAAMIMPRWKRLSVEAEFSQVPQQLLLLALDAIDAGATRAELEMRRIYLNRFDGLHGEVDSAHAAAQAGSARLLEGALVPYAADCVADVAVGSRKSEIYTYEDTDETIEAFILDTHAYVAMELAGRLWDNSNPVARRAYWLNFLTREVPTVMTQPWDRIATQIRTCL